MSIVTAVPLTTSKQGEVDHHSSQGSCLFRKRCGIIMGLFVFFVIGAFLLGNHYLPSHGGNFECSCCGREDEMFTCCRMESCFKNSTQNVAQDLWNQTIAPQNNATRLSNNNISYLSY